MSARESYFPGQIFRIRAACVAQSNRRGAARPDASTSWLELLRLATVDNGRCDVRRQPGKTQEGINVGGAHTLVARDVVYGQVGILTQPPLDIVRASDNSEQARIGRGLVIRALDPHSHFAADPFEACWHS